MTHKFCNTLFFFQDKGRACLKRIRGAAEGESVNLIPVFVEAVWHGVSKATVGYFHIAF